MKQRSAKRQGAGDASGPDALETLRLVCAAAQRAVGLEKQVAFDRETERTADGCVFREPDIAEFGPHGLTHASPRMENLHPGQQDERGSSPPNG